ncbi:MAG: phosphatidylserine decarboxylase, partial [Gammaproteobacteria bacterium]|nr:phosphatidylserine decarboxylase [Gammaproteobacteria bacterium]
MTRRILLIFNVLISSVIYADDHLVISDALIVEAPPTISINAGYLIIENQSNETITLTAITSDAYQRIEIHESVQKQGLASMVHHQSIYILPNSSIKMMPGGYHLMIYNNGIPPKLGDKVPVRFSFSDGTEIEIEMEVKNNPVHEETAINNHQASGSIMSYQQFLPQHFLSNLMYRLTRIRWAPLKNLMIGSFIKIFDVDMSIAQQSDYRKFRSFNEFFTRELKSTTRPVDQSAESIISPVDGEVSQLGKIDGESLLQAKDKRFTLNSLLGDDLELAGQFKNGTFITLYLSPRDYHRIHMPINGTLNKMTYIPGRLFSVNQSTTNKVDDLFAINERIINVFETDIGTVALIMVGAIFVGSMETVWAGEVTPKLKGKLFSNNYPDKSIRLSKGDEMGRFNMGSTVILLFGPDKVSYEPEMAAE